MLDFLHGPGLRWALTIMVFGLCWRLAHLLVRRGDRDLYWTRKAFHVPTERWQLDSYVMHAGLAVVIFGFSAHILLIREVTGIGWPSLPIAIVLFAGAMTMAAMAAVLVHRIASRDPSAFSAFDDYFSWLVVFAAVATGMLAYPHVGGRALVAPYRALLTAHLLSVEILMVWLPFGKLGHVALMPLGRLVIRLIGLVRDPSARTPSV